MEYFVGIDLGTSSVRAVAVDPDGNAAAAGQCEYDIQKPELDRAEQDMNQLNQTLMAPIQQKATDVVNTLAKAKGVIYVFNSTSLLYIDETQSIDLTPEARTMLNIPDDKTIESVMAARQAQAEAAAAAPAAPEANA